MDLLLDKYGLIIEMGNEITFGTYEGEQKWKITDYYYMTDNEYSKVTVETVPPEVRPYKYYLFGATFVVNPNYKEFKTIEEEHEELRVQVEEHELSQAETELDIDARLISLELGLV